MADTIVKEETVSAASTIQEKDEHINTLVADPKVPVYVPVYVNPRPVVQGFWKSRLAIHPGFEGDPRETLSRPRKAVILAVIAQAGCLGGFSSTIYVSSKETDRRKFSSLTLFSCCNYIDLNTSLLSSFSSLQFPSLVQITKDLNASTTTINSSVSLFILFMGISPLLTSTLSDHFKFRRVLYLTFTFIFFLASFGGGFSKSAGPLIAARVFQAIGSGGASILGAGTVADIYVSNN